MNATGSNTREGRRSQTAREDLDAAIVGIKGRQVLDSRGNPTVEAELRTFGDAVGRAIVPSGASTGVHEAIELRDGQPGRFAGKGVLRAVANIESVIQPALLGKACNDQKEIDAIMIRADGTPNKSRLGANAILAVSMAASRAAAQRSGEPLYRYLNARERYTLPIPMMNVINGGKHAGNKLSVQEFLIEPVGAPSFSEALRSGVEIYHSLKQVLAKRYGATATNVGDEGGYAPPFERTHESLDAIVSGISEAGYDDVQVKLGIDAASSSFYDSKTGRYKIDGSSLSPDELLDYYAELATTYPLATIEDPFSEDDFDHFSEITQRIGKRVRVIGDDLYVTNITRIKQGIASQATNAVLIKLNQVGTLSETIDAINTSKDADWTVVVSHRSGETEDVFISHLACAFEATFIKTGAPARGERVAKYNELLRIEEDLAGRAIFAGTSFGRR